MCPSEAPEVERVRRPKPTVPSIPAAILAGAIGVPLSAFVAEHISRATGSGALTFAWVAVTFFVPMFVATVDFRVWRRYVRHPFRIHASRADFREFYFPTWKRMGVLWLSAAISFALLAWLGVFPV